MVNNYVLYCSHNTYNLKCYLETRGGTTTNPRGFLLFHSWGSPDCAIDEMICGKSGIFVL